MRRRSAAASGLRAAASSLLVASTLAIDTSSTGAAIEYPAIVYSSSTVTLTLSEYTYVGPSVTQNTRTFNGELTGPTISVNPGDCLAATESFLSASLAADGPHLMTPRPCPPQHRRHADPDVREQSARRRL